MKKKVLLALAFVLILFANVMLVYADSITGPGGPEPNPGTKAYYWNGEYGCMDLTDGREYALTVTNIDASGIAGNKAFQFVVQDLGTGTGWETIAIQVHVDFYGGGGHLLQSNQWWPTPPWAPAVASSHGFNPGDVPGTFDLRMLVEDKGTYYHITPQFRLPSGSWTTFWDGPWDTNPDFELQCARLLMQNEGSADGTVTFDAPTADPFPPISGCCPPPPVGGIWTPINKFELLAPYIGLASLITIAAISIIYIKHRKKKQT